MMQAIKKLYNFVQQNLFCKIVTYFLVFAPIVICMEKGTSVKKVQILLERYAYSEISGTFILI